MFVLLGGQLVAQTKESPRSKNTKSQTEVHNEFERQHENAFNELLAAYNANIRKYSGKKKSALTEKRNQLIELNAKYIDAIRAIKSTPTVTAAESPVEISNGSIGTDLLKQPTLNLTWKNVDKHNRTISAVRFRIQTFNDFGEQLNKGSLALGYKRIISQDDCLPNTSQSGTWNLVFQDTASTIKVQLDDIVYTDGSKFQSNGKTKVYTVKK
jgi:hypothetical protein